MPAWVPAAIAAGATLLGQERANKAAKSSAREQMEFQREMSNTAHQRQIADMRAAGLNPILSGHKTGATTPAGAKYEPKNPFEKAITNALMVSQMEQAEANVELTKAKTVIEQQKGGEGYGTSQTMLLRQQIKNLDQTTRNLRMTGNSIQIKNTLDAWRSNWYRNVYKAPKETMTAKFSNYLQSYAFSGLDKNTKAKFIQNSSKAFRIVNEKFGEIVQNPEKAMNYLTGILGTAAASFVIRQLMNSAPRNIQPKSPTGGNFGKKRFKRP